MDPDLSIVLLGKSGAGKSSSGNTILGRTVFESKSSFRPVTKGIREETGRVFGKQISVIDTPGILESEQEIETCCQDLLKSDRPVLFLVVTPINQFSEEDQEAVEAAIRVIGPQGFRNAYLLFTCGDALKNMFLDEFLLTDAGGSRLNDVKMSFEDRHHLFNNQNEDQEQVQELLEKLGHLRSEPTASRYFEPVCLEERRIVLLGRPGGGRSSSGNTILGSLKFKSDCDFDLVTTETVTGSAKVEGQQVTVVDTPGFTEEDLTDEKMCEVIRRMIVEASPGPHAFVIVVRIGGVSEADKKMFEILKKLFGGDAFKYTMVLFTGGDDLRGQSIDQMIQFNSSVSDLVFMCGGRYCVFDNNRRGNRKQVREFLSKIDEMVTDNGGKHYTSDMFRMVETFIREERLRREEMNRLEEERLRREERNRVVKRLMPPVMCQTVGGWVGGFIGAIGGAVVGAAVGAVAGVAVGVVGGAVGAVGAAVGAGICLRPSVKGTKQ